MAGHVSRDRVKHEYTNTSPIDHGASDTVHYTGLIDNRDNNNIKITALIG